MTLFKSQLMKLEKENTEAFQSIHNSNTRKEIVDMVKYLSASPLSLYQIQVIRKDLIGMAAEGEQNQIPLKEVLGVDAKEFCDEVIQNSDHRAPWEHLIRYLQTILSAWAVVYSLKFILLNSAPDTFGIDYSDFVWLIIWIIGGVFLPEYLDQKTAVYENSVLRYLGWICRLAALLSYGLLCKSPLATQFIFTGNGWLILAVILIFWSGVTILMNWHWGMCAQRFSH